jgi:hypothetical protein
MRFMVENSVRFEMSWKSQLARGYLGLYIVCCSAAGTQV